jgi:hypothetical protein
MYEFNGRKPKTGTQQMEKIVPILFVLVKKLSYERQNQRVQSEVH